VSYRTNRYFGVLFESGDFEIEFAGAFFAAKSPKEDRKWIIERRGNTETFTGLPLSDDPKVVFAEAKECHGHCLRLARENTTFPLAILAGGETNMEQKKYYNLFPAEPEPETSPLPLHVRGDRSSNDYLFYQTPTKPLFRQKNSSGSPVIHHDSYSLGASFASFQLEDGKKESAPPVASSATAGPSQIKTNRELSTSFIRVPGYGWALPLKTRETIVLLDDGSKFVVDAEKKGFSLKTMV
jgi:hypothetical protein